MKSLLLFFLLLSTPLHAATPDARDIVARMVDKLRANANIADYKMTVTTPSWSRDLSLKVWDDRKSQRVFVRVTDPPKDAGTTFLRIHYNLWMYLPKTERVMKIPPSMMLQPWMGSDFTNDDLVKESSYIDDYTHTLETETGDAYRVRLDPKPNAPVVWSKVVVTVRKADFLPVEHQFFDGRGQLVKTLHFQDLKVMDGILFPSMWKMVPETKPGHQTVIHLKSIDFNPSGGISSEIFTEKNLSQ